MSSSAHRHPKGLSRSCLLAFTCSVLLASGLKAQTINVLVVYTPAVEAALGVNGSRALAISSIESLNQIMRKSGLPSVSYRLAGNSARKVDYVESANRMELDLDRLQDPADGFMDVVHTWRAQVGADLVHLLRLGPAGNVGGIAYLSVEWNVPPPPAVPGPSGDPAFGFAVTAHDSAVSGFTFAHEIGHNMGLYHAREDTRFDSDDPSNRDYWFGYRFRSLSDPTQVFNTVMAYESTVPDLTQSRIPHFSNPLVRYAVAGDRLYPTGLRSTGAALSSYIMPPETAGLLPQGPSDQVSALRENAPEVAAYFVNPPPASTLAAMGNWEFAPVRVGSSVVGQVVLQNRGSSPVTVDPLVLPDPVFTTSWAGGVIPPRGAIRVPVRFQPSAAGSYGGDVSITAGGALQATVSCRGKGMVAVASPAPPPATPSLSFSGSWQFAPVRVGRSAVRRVTIRNRGSSPVTVAPLAMPDPVFSTSWAGGTIPPRGSVSVRMTFRPAAATDYSGVVSITADGAPVADVICRGTGRP